MLGPCVFAAALYGVNPGWFILGVTCGLLSDLADGVVARHLNVVTRSLREADSWVDTWFYICAVVGVTVAHPDQIWSLRLPLLVVMSTQLASWSVDWLKFGRLTTYHSLSAKIWSPLLAIALVALGAFGYAGLTMWVAIVWGVLSHLDTMVMTLVLPEWRHDVLTLPAAVRLRREIRAGHTAGGEMSMLDRSFVLKASPMHVGAILILDADESGLDRLVQLVESAAAGIPQLGKLLNGDGTEASCPVHWHSLPPAASRADLLGLVEALHALPLEPALPPWELHVFERLSDRSVALYFKIHHALTDGVGGLRTLFSIIGKATADDRPHEVRRARGSAPAWLRLLFGTCVRTLVIPAPRMPFNVRVGGRRRMTLIRLSLDDLRTASAREGATTNDILLAAVAAGIVGDFVHRGWPFPHRDVRILVPVSVRSDEDAAMGNRIAGVVLELPTRPMPPAVLVRKVASISQAARRLVRSAGQSGAIFATTLPLNMLHALAPLTGLRRQWLVNLMVSNLGGTGFVVDGPGYRLLEVYPITSLGLDLAVSICAVCYGPTMYVTLLGDPEVIEDMEVIAACMVGFVGEVGAAEGLTPSCETDRRRGYLGPAFAPGRELDWDPPNTSPGQVRSGTPITTDGFRGSASISRTSKSASVDKTSQISGP